MATKKTDTKKKMASAKGAKATKTAGKAAPKKAAKPKAEAKPVGPRHPRGRLVAAHNSKAELAKSLAGKLAHNGEDAGTVEDRRSKRRAADVADDVTGVKHVQNNLRYSSGVVSPKLD